MIKNRFEELNSLNQKRKQTKKSILSGIEQLMLILMWMRVYPHESELSFLFGVSESTCTKIIHKIIPLLNEALQSEIRWPMMKNLRL